MEITNNKTLFKTKDWITIISLITNNVEGLYFVLEFFINTLFIYM